MLIHQLGFLQMLPLAHLLLGSRGPSTVILMALWYVATCGGFVKTVIVSVKLFPATGKKCYWAHVLGKGVFLISDSTRTQQMALEHFSCLYLKTDMCPGSGVYNLTTAWCWMHSLRGNCSKLSEKKINLYLNDLHFVCKKRRLPLRVNLIYTTAGTLSVLSKGC